MTILDLLTLLSYIALNVDIVFQIKRICLTKSSHDLSLTGMSIRCAAILIILIKFISMSGVPLIIGQGLIVLTFSTYFALAIILPNATNARAAKRRSLIGWSQHSRTRQCGVSGRCYSFGHF